MIGADRRAALTNLSWMKVLIVDDQPQVGQTVRDMLRTVGVTDTIFASDGQEALEMLRHARKAVHVLITDWNMPKMNGMELITAARELCPDLGIVMITGRADGESVDQAREEGIMAYIRKPFSAEQLRAKMIVIGRHVHRRAVDA